MNRMFSPDDATIKQLCAELDYLAGLPSPHQGPRLRLSCEQLSHLVETAFWASLRSNEGRPTRVCMTLTVPASARDCVKFATNIPFDERQIAKLAPAVPEGRCLVVALEDQFRIWGIARKWQGEFLGPFTIEAFAPGIIRIDAGGHEPYAVLDGRSNRIIASTSSSLGEFLRSVLREPIPTGDFFESQAIHNGFPAFRSLVRMIVAAGHGGLVLIVPSESSDWSKSLSYSYEFSQPDTSIRDGIQEAVQQMRLQSETIHRMLATDVPDDLKLLVPRSMGRISWDDETRVRAIAALAGVDGAIVMTQDLQVYGFGATIRSSGEPEVGIVEPMSGKQKIMQMPLRDLPYGKRHESAVRFVDEHRKAVALVVSQDGHLSIIHWSEQHNLVLFLRQAEWWL